MLEMVYTIEYKRTVRVQPYETVTISLMDEFHGAGANMQGDYEGLKYQVDKWVEEARKEFGEK